MNVEIDGVKYIPVTESDRNKDVLKVITKYFNGNTKDENIQYTLDYVRIKICDGIPTNEGLSMQEFLEIFSK